MLTISPAVHRALLPRSYVSLRSNLLEQLEPIAKRIIDVPPHIAGEEIVSDHDYTRLTTASKDGRQVPDEQYRVGLSRRMEVVLDSEMELLMISDREPDAAALSELKRCGYFSKSEHAAVKGARRVLLTNGHGYLDVIDATIS